MTESIDPIQPDGQLPDLADAVKKDMRTALEALRDILAHEIQGNRCKQCQMTQMRTGEFSALALRLQKVLEDLEKLPKKQDSHETLPEGVHSLDSIRNRERPHLGLTGTETSALAARGTKNAERRQGGRKPRRGSD